MAKSAIRGDCEALVKSLLEEKRHSKIAVGSYRFELQRQLRTVVKWGKDDPDLVQGVEPFAHLSDALRTWALDPRLVEPSKDVVGADELTLFTEKLNLKRAHKGGPIVLHQDFPYWSGVSKWSPAVIARACSAGRKKRDSGASRWIPPRSISPA